MWLLGLFVVALGAGLAPRAGAQPVGGTPVDFPAVDEAGKPVALKGMLWSPPAEPKGAVVLLHGAGGWDDFRQGHYGRALSAGGYAVLAVDSFGPRGVGPGTDHYRISFEQMARDAFAGRSFLLAHGMAPGRIAVMGLSKGGAGALYAADRHFLPQQADRFPVAIALYPVCHLRARTSRPASRLWIGLGEKDDLTGVSQCQQIADATTQAGGQVTVKVYPDSSHGFDGNPANTSAFYAGMAESFTKCAVVVEADGQETYDGKTYPANGDAILQAMRKSCIHKGASFWTNVRQKQAATQDIVAFLNLALAP